MRQKVRDGKTKVKLGNTLFSILFCLTSNFYLLLVYVYTILTKLNINKKAGYILILRQKIRANCNTKR